MKEETYLCTHCEAPMRLHNDALYRTCKCKRSDYTTLSGVQKNLPLMPYTYYVQEELCFPSTR